MYTHLKNEERIYLYPLVITLVVFTILLLNIFLGNGWQGYFGKLFGKDFITFVAIGEIFRHNPADLFNFDKQLAIEQGLIAPTLLDGAGPNSYPPYVAAWFSILTLLPLKLSFLIWTSFSLILVFLCAKLLTSVYAPDNPKWQVVFFWITSSSPFILGLYGGAMHTILLLLVTVTCICTLKGQRALAGCVGGLLLCKPQYALGFIALWLGRSEFSAVFFFFMSGLFSYLAPLIYTQQLSGTMSLLFEYFKRLPQIAMLVNDPGMPAYLMVTPFSFLLSFRSLLSPHYLLLLSSGIGLLLFFGLLWLAKATRNVEYRNCGELFCLASCLGLLASPYALAYDLIIIGAPLFIFGLARKNFRNTAIWIYVLAIVLPIVSFLLGVNLTVFIPLLLTTVCLKSLQSLHKTKVLEKIDL